MNCIIIDLDNCIFDDSHRRHHLEVMPRNWDAYFDECDGDEPYVWSKMLINLFNSSLIRVVFLTGRTELVEQKTISSLRDKFGLEDNSYNLFMRKEGDFRNAVIYKEEVIKEIIECGDNNILFAIDDDCKVAEMYKRNGITCLVPWNQRRE